MNKPLFLKLGAGSLLLLLVSSIGRGKPPGWDDSKDEIEGLDPRLQKLARRFISAAWRAGIPVVLTSGYRSHSRQQTLYDQGRTTPGKVVTNAKPGSSWHNHRLAFDAAILEDGDPTWPAATDPVWQKLGKIGEKLGLNHGRSFGDNPHFDYHPKLSLSEARQGKKIA